MNGQNKKLTILRTYYILQVSVRIQHRVGNKWKKKTKHNRLALILKQNLARCSGEFLQSQLLEIRDQHKFKVSICNIESQANYLVRLSQRKKIQIDKSSIYEQLLVDMIHFYHF